LPHSSKINLISTIDLRKSIGENYFG